MEFLIQIQNLIKNNQLYSNFEVTKYCIFTKNTQMYETAELQNLTTTSENLDGYLREGYLQNSYATPFENNLCYFIRNVYKI